MAQHQDRGDDPFELVDSKLTIYALANGMDLIKEPGVRRLAWYRDGREREVRIHADGSGFSLEACAFKATDPGTMRRGDAGRAESAEELAAGLTALLEAGQTRANEL